MDTGALAAAHSFGLDMAQPAESLCGYAPVYRISDKTGDWVLKRTGFPHSTANAIAQWLRFLDSQGISVVAPSDSFRPNPRQIKEQADYWVVYPFVPGVEYTGLPSQIKAAGALLGSLHAYGRDYAGDLLCVAGLPVHDAAWTAKHVNKALASVSEFAPDILPDFQRVLDIRWRVQEGFSPSHPLSGLDLAACSWDFKASNLVYRGMNEPVLVDPDHGGRIPRIYDLACSVLLFHCDHRSSPHRLFSKKEWNSFLSGYLGAVSFNSREHSCWQQVLALAWMDQGIWLLGNWPEGWQDLRERAYLRDLAVNRLEEFGLGNMPGV